MQDLRLTIKENTRLTEKMYRMVLVSDAAAEGSVNADAENGVNAAAENSVNADAAGLLRQQLPGQFINLKIDGFFLRRPISVCDSVPGEVTIIYAVVGKGTEALSEMKAGEEITALCGLGNGYDLSDAGDAPLLLGGGAGVPPMYLLAKQLRAEGKKVTVVLGFNTASEVYYDEEFYKLGCRVILATADGSLGAKGFVTDVMPDEYSYVYTCGPEPMLKAVYKKAVTSGQYSFEERMGCGFGACMGCSCKTITGYKRICKDGPVLRKEEILWED